MDMSAQPHASSSSSSQKQQQQQPVNNKHGEEEEEESAGALPELRSPILPSVTTQMQIQISPIGHAATLCSATQKQLAVAQAPRPFHQYHYQYYQHVYPPQLATHQELLENRDLFFSTLTKFHMTLGTKLTIPKIGGKDLDLHLLYREVTARGGLERVINERKWKEITVVLNFPRTTTSASFVLRKYYSNLLHHYEQVHFFQVQGPLVPPPVPPPSSTPAMNQIIRADYTRPVSEDLEADIRTRKIDSAQALGVDPASSIGSIVTGSIDGKLDYAYLVTVMVGTRKMRGILYHVPPSGSRPQGASVSTFMNSRETDFRTSMLDHRLGRKRKRKEMSRKDPNAPRQNKTGYNFFFAEQRARLKSVQPDKDRAISKMIGDLWNRLSEDDKSPYQERGLVDKERYKREMREYKERLRLESQGAVGTSGFHPHSLRTARKYDPLSNDATQEGQLRLQDSKPLQVQVQPISEIRCSGTGISEKLSGGSGTGISEKPSCGSGMGISEKLSCGSGMGSSEKLSCGSGMSISEKLSCGSGIGLVEDQPSKNHQSPKGESHVTVQEQGVHGVSSP